MYKCLLTCCGVACDLGFLAGSLAHVSLLLTDYACDNIDDVDYVEQHIYTY